MPTSASVLFAHEGWRVTAVQQRVEQSRAEITWSIIGFLLGVCILYHIEAIQ